MNKLRKYTAILASLIVAVVVLPSSAQASDKIIISVPSIVVAVGGGYGYNKPYYKNSYSKKKYYNNSYYNSSRYNSNYYGKSYKKGYSNYHNKGYNNSYSKSYNNGYNKSYSNKGYYSKHGAKNNKSFRRIR